MIGATYPVLASFTGSEQSLSRSLSPVDRVPAESSPPPVGASRFHSGKPLLYPSTCQFSRRNRHRKLQKAIQYPATGPGSVQ